MNQTRQAIAEILRNLKKDWSSVLKVLYPYASPCFHRDYGQFLYSIKREEKENVVMSSNGQDRAALTFSSCIDVDTLHSFLSEHVGKKRYFCAGETHDYDGYPEMYCYLTENAPETDAEYLNRLTQLQAKLFAAKQTKEQKIEELKAQLRALEAE